MNAYPNANAGMAERISQVEQQFRTLSEQLEVQEKCIHELKAKLTNVLTPEPAVPKDAQPMPRQLMVPLAERIDQSVGHLKSNTESIRRIMERLEN